MVETRDIAESASGETSKLIDEYREKIMQSLEHECRLLRERAERESRSIIAQAYQDVDTIKANAREEAQQLVEEARKLADQEAAKIIHQANQQAGQNMADARERAKKEGAEKKKREAQRIEQKAWDESRDIVNQARQGAEKQAQKITEEAEKEAERITANARKAANEEAKEEASRIIAEAKAQVQNERNKVLSSTINEVRHRAEKEAEQVIEEAREQAEKIINDARGKVMSEYEDSLRLFSEIKQRLGNVAELAEQPAGMSDYQDELLEMEIADETPDEEKRRIIENKATDPSVSEKDNRDILHGTLEIKVLPPADLARLAELEKNLLKVTHLKVTGKGGSSNGTTWIRLELEKPLPMVKLLKHMPSVKEAFILDNNLHVVLQRNSDKMRDYKNAPAEK